MSGLSYFAIQIQSFFKTQSKSNQSPKLFSTLKSKSKKFEKCDLFTTKMPHFFSIELSPNPVRILNIEEMYSSDSIRIQNNLL